jgi:hypothetical protein
MRRIRATLASFCVVGVGLAGPAAAHNPLTDGRIAAADAQRAVDVLERLLETYPPESRQAMEEASGAADCHRAFLILLEEHIAAETGRDFAHSPAVRRILARAYPEPLFLPVNIWRHDINAVAGEYGAAGEANEVALVRETLQLFRPLEEALGPAPPAPVDAARERLISLLEECRGGPDD